MAELRGGAVWDAAAVRKFATAWERKPGRPVRREPRRTGYRRSDGRLVDLTHLESKGYVLTQEDLDRMAPEELDRILREADDTAAHVQADADVVRHLRAAPANKAVKSPSTTRAAKVQRSAKTGRTVSAPAAKARRSTETR